MLLHVITASRRVNDAAYVLDGYLLRDNVHDGSGSFVLVDVQNGDVRLEFLDQLQRTLTTVGLTHQFKTTVGLNGLA